MNVAHVLIITLKILPTLFFVNKILYKRILNENLFQTKSYNWKIKYLKIKIINIDVNFICAILGHGYIINTHFTWRTHDKINHFCCISFNCLLVLNSCFQIDISKGGKSNTKIIFPSNNLETLKVIVVSAKPQLSHY